LKCIILLLFTILLHFPVSSFALENGEIFPPLPATTLEGKVINLGQLSPPLLLTVGTTWCPSCRSLAKRLAEIRPFLQEHGITYVEVFLNESAQKVGKYLEESGLPHPDVVLLDRNVISRALNVRMVPRLILIDKEFRVYRDGSPLSAAVLQQELSRMIQAH